MTDENDEKIKQAFDAIRRAMVDDDPSQEGSYARAWHDCVAMACYDALPDVASHMQKSKVANHAASRFMKTMFDVRTKGPDDDG